MQVMQGALIIFVISAFFGLAWLFQKKAPAAGDNKRTSPFGILLPLVCLFGLGYGVFVGFPKFAKFLKTDVRTVQREALADAIHGWPSALEASGSKQRVMPLGIPFELECTIPPGDPVISRRQWTVDASVVRFDKRALNFYTYSIDDDAKTEFSLFFGIDKEGAGRLYEGYWGTINEAGGPSFTNRFGSWFLQRVGNAFSGECQIPGKDSDQRKRTFRLVLKAQ